MEQAKVPTENVFEPNEQARQPQHDTEVSLQQKKRLKKIAFAEGQDSMEVSSSQRSSIYKEALSQPASSLSRMQRLQWLQNRRRTGLWVQCDSCDRWRYLPEVLDCHELPKKWYCYLNPDTEMANCAVPEMPIQVWEEEDLIHSEYSAGSIVWARLPGWPWWPAMVDDCPDNEQFYWLDGFSDIPTHYNVVFFDSNAVTRAWIAASHLKPYIANKKSFQYLLKDRTHMKRIQTAMNQADDANQLSLQKRLKTYSFIARYKGPIVNPQKISKKILKKYQKKFEKKYDVNICSDSSDSEFEQKRHSRRNLLKKSTIKLGKTPKTNKDNSLKNKTANKKNDEETTENIALFIARENCTTATNSLAVQKGTESVSNTEHVNVDACPTSTTKVDNDALKNLTINEVEVRVESSASGDFDF